MEITLTDKERRDFLKAYNHLRDIINNIHECHDIWMSDVGKLEYLQNLLRHTLKFTAPLDDDGNKLWYGDHVLEEQVSSND